MKNILLDTNCYVRFCRGDAEVFSIISESETVNISAVVLGELFAGFRGGNKYKQNKKELDMFLSKSTIKILNVNTETAEIFGEIKNTLKQNGTPLPINDIWIASHAIETASIIVSYDNHFKLIPGLRLWENLKPSNHQNG